MAREIVRIGFMPIADAALPLVAARLGFGRDQGLDIDLVKESSWANIRDRLAVGQFDAAHLLAPMPVASALGLMPLHVPLIAPMALGLGGNAVTVSGALWQEMQTLSSDVRVGDPFSTGAALRLAVRQRQRVGRAMPVFAVVHAFSAHNYELRYWLTANGIRPDRDVRIDIVSPPFMPDALAQGGIDGFCVGEPWNTLAADDGNGVVVLRKTDIWRASPEKVLGLRRDWAEAAEDRVVRLVVALPRAADWCADPDNRADLAGILAAPDTLGVPVSSLMPVLGSGLRFAGNAATFPWLTHARWFAQEMLRCSQAAVDPARLEAAVHVYRPDIYRTAAAHLGMNVPAGDEQPDACEVMGTKGPLALEPSRFFDQGRAVGLPKI